MTLIHRIVPLTLSLCSLLVSAAEMTQENSTARGSLVDSALEQRVTWPSAAEMDWVRYDTAEPSESNGTLMCEGRYVEPIATSSEWQSDPVNVENVRITAHQSSGQIDKQWIFEGT
ncbi:MAG: hypothetical protein OEZ23_09120, partial [Gammaproteobacteria bacterium]|nr:hypothetical protein [Gammaproteobacteria bacterium]